MVDTLNFTTEQKQVSGVFYNNSQNGMIIYTEDTDNEQEFYKKFYNHLLSETEIKIDKVIQLGCCDNVEEACRNDNDFSIPKLFVIDGDIYLMYSPKQEEERLFVLDRYCIENYLLDEETICHTIQHFKTQSFDTIKNDLALDSLLSEYVPCMINIYYYYALLSEENKKNRSTRTAGYTRKNFDSFFDMANNIQRDVVVNRFIDDSKKELLKLPNINEDYITERLNNLEQQYPKNQEVFMCIVSGKDDILPFVIKKAEKKFGFSVSDLSTWKFNSADYFDISKAQALRNKIISTYDKYKESSK